MSNCAYNTKEADLFVPELSELAQVLQAGLTKFYKNVRYS
jgi:hypothetical protein